MPVLLPLLLLIVLAIIVVIMLSRRVRRGERQGSIAEEMTGTAPSQPTDRTL